MLVPVLAQQNLGAAIRAAYFLGADGVLCCSRNSAPLSPAVSKASAGALEHLPIHACRSMPRTLARAAAQGWAVMGARPLDCCSVCSAAAAAVVWVEISGSVENVAWRDPAGGPSTLHASRRPFHTAC